MAQEDAAQILNELIATSEDGHKGFAEAAESAQDVKLKLLFKERATECERAVRELQQCVQALGAKPEDSGTVAGAAHRGWVKVKAAVTDPDLAVLEETERGEDHAKAVYAKALKGELPPQARKLVEQQQQGVLRNHDRIRDLRNRFRAAA